MTQSVTYMSLFHFWGIGCFVQGLTESIIMPFLFFFLSVFSMWMRIALIRVGLLVTEVNCSLNEPELFTFFKSLLDRNTSYTVVLKMSCLNVLYKANFSWIIKNDLSF